MATTTAQKKVTEQQPFGIEVDADRNSDLLIQSIPNCRLRSRIRSGRTTTDLKTGKRLVPPDQSRHLGILPEIPGMQIHVNPKKGTYVVLDPLSEDQDLCDEIHRLINQNRPTRGAGELRGVPTLEGRLDPHRMKTLCRELVWILESGDAQLVEGIDPRTSGMTEDAEGRVSTKSIDALPGDYLLNPGSRVFNMQPQFEKDMDSWLRGLSRSGA